MVKIDVPVLSYEDLRREAGAFLAKYRPHGGIPVPIERICEFDMGLDVSPEMCLRSLCGVDAFINAGCTVIHVDVTVYMSKNTNRFRFSLAHEVAHAVLHKQVMKQLPFKTFADWKRVHATLPAQQHVWLEWQAYAFAGLILVPPADLATEYPKAIKAAKAESGGQRDPVLLKDLAIELLAEQFSVSREVMERRVAKDIHGC